MASGVAADVTAWATIAVLLVYVIGGLIEGAMWLPWLLEVLM